MLAAEIYGKMSGGNPAYERMEDILTSYVLSLFRYLNNLEIMEGFLRKARNIEGHNLTVANVKSGDVFFWPLLNFGGTNCREPDAFICLEEENGKKLAVAVEAKYHSGLSNILGKSEASGKEEAEKLLEKEGESLVEFRHQLADEYCGLKCGKWTFRKVYSKYDPQIFQAKAERKYLLYITSHHEFPKGDIMEAIEATRDRKGCERALGNCGVNASNEIYWVGWRDLYAVIEEKGMLQVPSKACMDYTASEQCLIADLAEVLRIRGLKTFDPFRDLKPVQLVSNIIDDHFLFDGLKPVGLYESIIQI